MKAALINENDKNLDFNSRRSQRLSISSLSDKTIDKSKKKKKKKKKRDEKSTSPIESDPIHIRVLSESRKTQNEKPIESTTDVKMVELNKPQLRKGFCRQKKDGITSLNFLPGGEGIIPGTEKDRPISLGELIGKVKQGTGAIQKYKEDGRNIVKSVYPLYYGAYCSYGPSYDSTFSRLTKDESNLVYSAIRANIPKDDTIIETSNDCDYYMNFPNHLIDIMTGKDAQKPDENKTKNLSSTQSPKKSPTKESIEQKSSTEDNKSPAKKEESTEEKMDVDEKENKSDDKINAEKPKENQVDFDALKSLEEVGIDMSFLEELKSQFNEKDQSSQNTDDVDEELKTNANLLDDLYKIQKTRLSQDPPTHFSQVQPVTEDELNMAKKVKKNLLGMARGFKPEDVVSVQSVRKMMGVKYDE